MDAIAETAGGQHLPSEPIYAEGALFATGLVYRNLIVNAIEATSPRGTSRSPPRMSLREPGTVRDTGLGLQPDRLEVIFEDFKTTKRRGLMLELSSSRKIVKPLEGTIRTRSEVGV